MNELEKYEDIETKSILIYLLDLKESDSKIYLKNSLEALKAITIYVNAITKSTLKPKPKSLELYNGTNKRETINIKVIF